MDVVANRRLKLRAWIDEKHNGNQSSFVSLTGINQGELSLLLRNKSFGEKKARSIEKLAGMPTNWLDTPINSQEPEENIVMAYDKIGTVENTEDLSAYTEVELYDVKLSAGLGVSWIPKKEETLVFRTAWMKKRGFSEEHCKGMYVRGDSMEPTILNWDTVLIDTSDTDLVTGEIYAVAYKDKFFLKEIRVRPESIELISRNPKYEPIIVPDNEANKFQVLGRLVWRGG